MWIIQLSVATVSACICLILAYVINVPLADGMTPAHIIKPRLALFNFARDFALFAESRGYDGLYVYGRLAGYVGWILSYFQSPAPKYNITYEDSTFDDVMVRIYTPNDLKQTPSPAIVYFHGGGWIMGSVGLYNSMTSQISQDTSTILVSVNYRLAPKHVFPAGFDDCYKATKYFLDHVDNYNVDRNRIAIMGDSAGGNLAAAVTQKLNDEKVTPMPKLQDCSK